MIIVMMMMMMMMIMIIIMIIIFITIRNPFGSSDNTDINPKRFVPVLIRCYNNGSVKPVGL
jgi:uncharacterized membrane protein